MKNNIKFLSIFILLIVMTMGAVSADDTMAIDDNSISTSSEYTITESNYSDFFDESGNLNDSKVLDGDTLILSGGFTEKSFSITRNITFTGNNATISNGSVVLQSGASGSTVSNLTINNINCSGLYSIELKANNCSIINNYFIFSSNQNFKGYPIEITGSNNVISDNYIKSVTYGTISREGLRVNNAKNNVIKNNYIEVSGKPGITFYGTASNNTLISNNTVNLTTPGNGIRVSGCTYCIVEFNKIIGANYGINSNSRYATIRNNTIISASTYGIYAVPSSGGDITCTGNIITGSCSSSGICIAADSIVADNKINVTGAGIGITLQGNNITVVNNTINTNTGVGISQTGTRNGLNVSNNYIVSIASKNGIGIQVSASGAVISGNTLTNGIKVADKTNNVTIMNNIFESSLVVDVNNTLIYAAEVSGLIIKNNTIITKGNNSNSTSNGIIYLKDVTNSQVFDNIINASIPSATTSYGPAPDYAPVYNSYVIQVTGDNNLIYHNNIYMNYTNIIGAYDALYAIILGGNNSVVANNTVKGKGNSYIYGVSASGDNINITGNKITIFESNYSANGISLGSPFNGVISNNVVNLTAKSVVYGTNDYTYNDDVFVLYDGNKFYLHSNSVYGLELMGTGETVVNNEIIATGNFTLGVAVYMTGEYLNLSNNKISINGLGLGTPTGGDMIPSMNVAIYTAGYNDESIINGNEIIAVIPSVGWSTESEAILSSMSDSVISGNKITVSVSNRNTTSYDSLYAGKLRADNINFTNNDITVNGANYVYGLQVYGEDMLIKGNSFNITSPEYYTGCIDVGYMGQEQFTGTISDNYMNLKAVNVTYGIISWGDVSAVYDNNTIIAFGNSVYAIEAGASNRENITNNKINAKGNYTIGIVVGQYQGNATVINNTVTIEGAGLGTPTTGDTFPSCNVGIFVYKYVNSAIITNNEIIATIPSCSWDKDSAAIVSLAEDASNILFKSNKMKVNVSNQIGAYDSIYGVKITGDNVIFQNNKIDVEGLNYAYGLKASGEKIAIDSNIITVTNKINYACGITLDTPFKGVTNNNTVKVLGTQSAYGIYTSTWGDTAIIANHTNNNIYVNANTAYGFQLLATQEIVSGNTVIVDGNYTMGFTVTTPNITIKNNTIKSNGLKDGSYSTVDMFGASNQGILLYNADINATIVENRILTTGNYAVNTLKSNKNPSTVTNNYLVAKELYGNASVNNITGNVSNNGPSELFETIISYNLTKHFNNASQFVVTVLDIHGNPVANKTVKFVLDGPTFSGLTYYRITNKDGIAILEIGLGAGEYSIETSTNKSLVVKNSITVLPMTYTFNTDDIYMFLKDGTKYSVTVIDADNNPVSNKKVSLILNGKSFKNLQYDITTDANGTATLPINLAIGSYTITAKYTEAKYAEGQFTSNIFVLKKGSNLVAADLVKYYKNGTQYTVKLLDSKMNPIAGKSITLTLSGSSFKNLKYYLTTDANGVAKLTINLASGQYSITASCNSVSTTSSIKVLPILTASSMTKKVNQPASLKAKLVDGQGKPVGSGYTLVFKVNTKEYSVQTDSNGIASLPINLGVATWSIQIIDYASNSKVTVTVKVVK